MILRTEVSPKWLWLIMGFDYQYSMAGGTDEVTS
jgi:hypothetical protein